MIAHAMLCMAPSVFFPLSSPSEVLCMYMLRCSCSGCADVFGSFVETHGCYSIRQLTLTEFSSLTAELLLLMAALCMSAASPEWASRV